MEENTAIIQISAAQQALDKTNDIFEMRKIGDLMSAAALFAERQGLTEIAQQAKVLQLKSDRKAGQWLAENVTHEGGNPQLSQDVTVLPDGITRIESSRLQQEAVLPEEKFNEWVDENLAKGWEISAAGLREEAKRHLRQEYREDMAEVGKDIQNTECWNVWRGDISTWQTSRQYDFIITDPPYPKEFLPLWEVLGRRANEWLKEGGLLIAMSGQSYLDNIFSILGQYLEYYWTAAYLTPGQPTPLRQVNVNSTWKPLLIYSKGKYSGKIFGDVFVSKGNDKVNHKWGQSESGMFDIISKICLPGQSILDPFCGAGTTGVAALRHGCLFDGLELEEENVNISKARLNDATETR